ncbi:MAG TPA: dTDP-4-dehydrorhamnose reductase [Chitinophagaceae bacterium]
MQTIIVTGSKGQLGQELQRLAPAFSSYTFHFFDRAELDITDAGQVHSMFASLKPAFCINCAAYTAVDKAETEQKMAYAINAEGSKNLAAASKEQGARFVHVSTDYVFNGRGEHPYKEKDPTDPVNLYGASKLKGEQLALEVAPDSVVIRTSWVYSAYGNNFVKTMLRLMQSRTEISVVADQVGSPTFAADLAETILQIIGSGKWQGGIYHFSNDGVISWHEFAREIQHYTHLDCIVHPISTEQYPTPAKRPKYSVMDKEKIQQVYGVTLVPWRSSLYRCLDLLKEEGAW